MTQNQRHFLFKNDLDLFYATRDDVSLNSLKENSVSKIFFDLYKYKMYTFARTTNQ